MSEIIPDVLPVQLELFGDCIEAIEQPSAALDNVVYLDFSKNIMQIEVDDALDFLLTRASKLNW